MRTLIRGLFVIACSMALVGGIATSSAVAAIDIVAATPELADITKQVGGDRVSVYSIAKPNQDYHMIEPRPSDVSRIARADMVVRIGLDLDMWLDALMNAAGNPKVRRGGPGYVDASVGIAKLEIPRESITGASGDIHVYGNPHYFYDPENGKIIAHNVLEGLIRVSPGNKAVFVSNYERFAKEIDHRTAAWQQELAPFKGKRVVTYHQSAIYFIRRFGLRGFGTLEVKPGIPPSASHVSGLIKRMRDEHVTAMAIESIYPRRFPDLIQRETGAKYVVVPYSVGSLGTKSYIDLIDMWVTRYKETLR
ncbi:MAG: metal ABC transporter substrate-binding protein [Armatimonadetes bacterium]|nr:metal ABC transporter substrate-binding protein [Armatimonadota bacterium]